MSDLKDKLEAHFKKKYPNTKIKFSEEALKDLEEIEIVLKTVDPKIKLENFDIEE